jgi:hypothetical protein
MVFARHLDSFIMTSQHSFIYQDLLPSRQFHRDQLVLVRLPGLAKTHANPDTDGNSIKPPGRYA